MFGVYVPITPSDISRLRLKWGYISEGEYWNNVQFDAEHLAWWDEHAQADAERKCRGERMKYRWGVASGPSRRSTRRR